MLYNSSMQQRKLCPETDKINQLTKQAKTKQNKIEAPFAVVPAAFSHIPPVVLKLASVAVIESFDASIIP